ncbi:RidA family protein [Flagellimonas olearia]|uniref:RidA family protein n=1 Tax=Flagellimonas olearia TaxID=552546 RepID=A0A6I1DY84_9FLAO|nr:RidA family protein [Allomuricauda olearia]KAB7530413.1 RidA family protein [Allomuricauda olearia]
MKRLLISSGSPFEETIGFSRAVRVGPYITIGGTAPLDIHGKTVGIGDITIQTKQCLETIKTALEKAGASLNDVVRTRMLLVDIKDWKEAAEVRAVYFKNIKPVDTIMQVSGFIDRDWLIEIEVDAITSKYGSGDL